MIIISFIPSRYFYLDSLIIFSPPAPSAIHQPVSSTSVTCSFFFYLVLTADFKWKFVKSSWGLTREMTMPMSRVGGGGESMNRWRKVCNGKWNINKYKWINLLLRYLSRSIVSLPFLLHSYSPINSHKADRIAARYLFSWKYSLWFEYFTKPSGKRNGSIGEWGGWECE